MASIRSARLPTRLPAFGRGVAAVTKTVRLAGNVGRVVTQDELAEIQQPLISHLIDASP